MKKDEEASSAAVDDSLSAAPMQALGITDPQLSICSAFSDSRANVVLKSADNVIFYVEDYYLKANRYVISLRKAFCRATA
jgi:hypothetical protein